MRRLFEMLIALGIGILLTVALITIVNIRTTQVDNSPLLDKINKQTHLIKSCVKPTGKCFKDGQERTGKAVANIGQVTILAAACASDRDLVYLTVTDRAARIQACIINELRKKHEQD